MLEDEPECREHGYLARGQALAADARGEPSEARQHLQRALEIAERFGDRDLETLALHAQGSMLVRGGEVDKGWALIDEAAAAGELQPTATGPVYCATISACRDLLGSNALVSGRRVSSNGAREPRCQEAGEATVASTMRRC